MDTDSSSKFKSCSQHNSLILQCFQPCAANADHPQHAVWCQGKRMSTAVISQEQSNS